MRGTESSDEARKMSLDIPHAWAQQRGSEREEVNSRWWHGFGSPELSALVERAGTQSLDVAAAVASAAGGCPRSLCTRSSGAGGECRFRGLKISRSGQSYGKKCQRTWRVGLSSSYELDFWGRQRR
jgi:outer membrane protein TolC